ncbi:MAG: TIGR03905 family TSCPD domain-containing protein [Ruminococcaceae bacterium]|nr:TIGR03905 family TSCPD domain-containing protein [Oscillospiraceae bacterium]
MVYTYRTQGTCARTIDIELEDGIIKEIRFGGGCAGNTQGIAKLVEGMKAEEVIGKLEGIRCGFKSTSCPDQLAKALRIVLEK